MPRRSTPSWALSLHFASETTQEWATSDSAAAASNYSATTTSSTLWLAARHLASRARVVAAAASSPGVSAVSVQQSADALLASPDWRFVVDNELALKPRLRALLSLEAEEAQADITVRNQLLSVRQSTARVGNASIDFAEYHLVVFCPQWLVQMQLAQACAEIANALLFLHFFWRMLRVAADEATCAPSRPPTHPPREAQMDPARRLPSACLFRVIFISVARCHADRRRRPVATLFRRSLYTLLLAVPRAAIVKMASRPIVILQEEEARLWGPPPTAPENSSWRLTHVSLTPWLLCTLSLGDKHNVEWPQNTQTLVAASAHGVDSCDCVMRPARRSQAAGTTKTTMKWKPMPQAPALATRWTREKRRRRRRTTEERPLTPQGMSWPRRACATGSSSSVLLRRAAALCLLAISSSRRFRRRRPSTRSAAAAALSAVVPAGAARLELL